VIAVDEDDLELLAALRAEVTDQTAPPVHTQLEDVVRQGRRQVQHRRIGATLGVVVVVTGIGISAAVLRGIPNPADDGTVVSSSITGTATTTSAMPGWTRVLVEAQKSGMSGCAGGVSLPSRAKTTTVDGAVVSKVLVSSLTTAAPNAKVRITQSSWPPDDPKPTGSLGSTWVDVIDSGGGGSVYMYATGYAGAASDAADDQAYVDGVCTPPMRKTLTDGSVLQLYTPEEYDKAHPSQELRVFTPAHHVFVLTAEGFSSADWVQVPGDDPGVLAVPQGAGRHSLSLTADQLAFVGERIAAVG
jgi:hypothetical protein